MTSAYVRVPDWLIDQINPHVVARTSKTSTGALLEAKECLHRFTVMSIVRCFLDFADLEFSRNLAESISQARGVYYTAMDLLICLMSVQRQDRTFPFQLTRCGTRCDCTGIQSGKIHNGMNIAGMRSSATYRIHSYLPAEPVPLFRVGRRARTWSASLSRWSQLFFLPSSSATPRTTACSRQITISRSRDLRLLTDLKLADANINEQVAGYELDRAQVQFDHYDQLIKGTEQMGDRDAGAMGVAVVARAAAPSAFIDLKSPLQ